MPIPAIDVQVAGLTVQFCEVVPEQRPDRLRTTPGALRSGRSVGHPTPAMDTVPSRPGQAGS